MVVQRMNWYGSNLPENHVTAAPCHLVTPDSSAQMVSVRQIFREYAAELGIDLCFQDFVWELDKLPGGYAGPRVALLLAMVNGELPGCCGLRPLNSVVLDTLDDTHARAMYRDLGFREIPAYYHNPLPGLHYRKLDMGPDWSRSSA
jgi:hypothetical protein